jgi:hypothetical protein
MKNHRALTVVSHDAGGAEVISSYIRMNKVNCKFVLDGPAVSIFKKKLGSIDIISIEQGLIECDELICGTSWQSNLEWLAIKLAREGGVQKISSFLDHWINYKDRFKYKGIENLPDNLIVGDEFAFRIAKDCFPKLNIKLIPNAYFIELRDKVIELSKRNPVKTKKSKKILFVSENISDYSQRYYGHNNYMGYTELEAIEYFISNLDYLGDISFPIYIRPHPSDKIEKYIPLTIKYPFIKLSDKLDLLQAICEADIIMGCRSMALVVGILAGKRVISCIPNSGLKCDIPYSEIENLNQMVRDQEFPTRS